ncbi:MAG: hypothetical protein AVDCRST_MAG66-1245 [uncultured Pseudonocardia sp.]|uniref:Uncharacterized protein n=1 Tax=uncultured Pseudonocardia sp. TaxID=211455 RepID=A0A6J4NU95_9PSEU|nr:MAG: hypothetical protein AVDCRST_MAG66-1245 [uncultured Pseudonocardia sp.]
MTDVQEGDRDGGGAGTLPAQIHELLEDAVIHGVLAPGSGGRPTSCAEALSRRHILDTGRAVADLLAAQVAAADG